MNTAAAEWAERVAARNAIETAGEGAAGGQQADDSKRRART